MNVLVLEGGFDLLMRIRSCLVGEGVNLYSSNEEWEYTRVDARAKLDAAIVGTSFLEDGQFRQSDWRLAQGIPVLWIGANQPPGIWLKEKSPTVLHLDFTCSQLRAWLQQQHIGGPDVVARAIGVPPDRGGVAVSAPPRILHESAQMAELIAECKAYAAVDNSVLLMGATGTGKELFARTIAQGHPMYGKGPFVAVNCGAVPEHLFESLFFGHAKGAFTGALRAHKGYMTQADGGTLYLDEIGDLPLLQQVKLLRALEDGFLLPVGSAEPHAVDFRLVAATNLDLPDLIRTGRFRADLYYRIAVIELRIPSLDERGPGDKSLIFADALQEAVRRSRGPASVPIPGWLDDLIRARSYPGNVRELINLANRVAVSYIRYGSFDRDVCHRLVTPSPREAKHRNEYAAAAGCAKSTSPSEERDRIISALIRTGWKRGEAAVDLGISRKTLWEKMRKFNLNRATVEFSSGEAQPSRY